MKEIRPNRYVIFSFARRVIMKTIVIRLFIPRTEASDQIQRAIITLARSEVLTAVTMKITTFWDVTPCNSELPVGFLVAYSSTLKIEAIFSSEMSDVFLFTRLYNPQYHTIELYVTRNSFIT
jgi:hypothetical protein